MDSDEPRAPAVAAVLGVKGPLRFRRHGASQKAHVVLRRVDVPGPAACFSLFAQKRIEVKPGKEILLAVAADDGAFTDQAVIFEGDLVGASEDEEHEVEKQIVPDPPPAPVIPPKMRRPWTKQHEQVSAPPDSPLRTHVSVGVQAQPTWSVSAVQVVPVPAESHVQLPAPLQRPVHTSPSVPSPQLIPPPDVHPILANDRSRSLSPMSIGSPPSTPPSLAPELPPTSPATPPLQKAPPVHLQAPWTHAASCASQISPVSSETVDMDLQSSPSSHSSTYSDDIPGFITGAASRRTRPPSPLVLPLAPIKSSMAAQTPVPQSAQTIVASPVSTVTTATAFFSAEPVPDKLVATPVTKRPPIKNPFVSAGFITEFVGEKDSLTTKRDSSVADKTPSPVEQSPVKRESIAPDSLPPPKPSPAPQPLKLIVPETRLPRILNQSFSASFHPPPSSSLPSRSSDEPSTGVSKLSYQPITSASDPRLSYTSTGSISNPLNIRPSRHAPLPPAKVTSRTTPPPRQAPKKKVVVGNGWPYNKQMNGHAATAAATSASPPMAKVTLPVVRPLTPESTRSSKTPPGLSGLAPYSSPSPPGFLHSSSAPRSAASTDQNRFGLFSQPLSATPQIKHEVNDWATLPLSQSPTSSAQVQNIPIQAPRPIAPLSASPAILQYTLGSNGSTPTRDIKGKKRALASDPDGGAESEARPRKRSLGWPSHDPLQMIQIKSDEDPGINYVSFSSDGERLAVICNDRTIRIWNMPSKVETARLAQNSPIVAVAWMSDDMGVVSLGRDGVIGKWTRTNHNHWQWAKLLDAGKEDSICFAYKRDRIAVAIPRIGVKVWIWIKGTWQPQRSILRQNVTCIQFVEDGEALIGGTSDGVLWYCQVPNGTLRAYAFLKAKVCHLDVNGLGTHALVSQTGGRAHLVGIQQTDHKGKIEQVYSTPGDTSGEQPQVGAVFSCGCKSILFGSTEGNLLVWDKTKGEVICGLDHGESEQVQAVACSDRGSQSYIVTGTKRGVLSWWKPPPTDS